MLSNQQPTNKWMNTQKNCYNSKPLTRLTEHLTVLRFWFGIIDHFVMNNNFLIYFDYGDIEHLLCSSECLISLIFSRLIFYAYGTGKSNIITSFNSKNVLHHLLITVAFYSFFLCLWNTKIKKKLFHCNSIFTLKDWI